MAVKVKVKFVVKLSNGDIHIGRESWIVREKNGALAFGNIYSQEKDAAILNDEEYNRFVKNAYKNNPKGNIFSSDYIIDEVVKIY